MKNKLYPLIILALAISITSCKKDNQTQIDNRNVIEYNGARSTLKAGALIDFGPYSYYGTTDTHLNYDFYTTDGAIIANAAGEIDDIKGKIAVWVWLESPGATTAFKTGTYTFIDGSNDATLTDAQLKAKYENKQFLVGGSVYINTNVDTSIDDNATQEIDIKSGSVTISGTKPNFIITYDLVMQNDKTLKGSYSKGFLVFTDI